MKKSAKALTTKKSAQALTPRCQQGHQEDENLYQPGMYWVEVTDHGIDKAATGAPTLWLEILPVYRDLGFDLPKGKNAVATRKSDPLAPYHDKRRIYLDGRGCEYVGEEADPIRIRADVLLHGILDSKSTDPHGLIGARLKFELAHLMIKDVMRERWMLQGPKRKKYGIEDCYN